MRLLSASALSWLLLGAIIIFFYLLKLKRKRRVVPSVLLWQRALEEVEANAPFKKLRRSLLLLLQLAALAALVFALARPLVQMRSLASGSTVIIIDSTASMRSRDEGTRRRHRRHQRWREPAARLRPRPAGRLGASRRVALCARRPARRQRRHRGDEFAPDCKPRPAGTLRLRRQLRRPRASRRRR